MSRSRPPARTPRPMHTPGLSCAAGCVAALWLGGIMAPAAPANDWLRRAEASLDRAADRLEADAKAVRNDLREDLDRELSPERRGKLRAEVRADLRAFGERLEEGGGELADRAERLADVPVRYFDTRPDDPDGARARLARDLDPTNVHGPLRGATRNPLLDPLMVVDWATPFRRRGFVAVHPSPGPAVHASSDSADGPPAPRYARSPVIYINGALTDKPRAVRTGQALADRLGTTVFVWHNETNGSVGDGLEALLNMADLPVGVGDELRDAVAGPRPVTVIGHSQGAAQLHAILTARKRRGLSNRHVACVLLGAPNAAETKLEVGKWSFVTYGDDLVPNLLGRNRPLRDFATLRDLTVDDHPVDLYVPLVTPEMLW